MTVDAHAHVLVRPSAAFPRRTSELYPDAREAPVEQLLAVMDNNGVEVAVLVEIAGQRKYLFDCLRRHPRRFRGVVALAPGDDLADEVPEELVPVIAGARLFELGNPGVSSARDLPSFDLLRTLQRRHMALSFYGDLPQLQLLARILEEFPRLTVVLNHLGLARGASAIDSLGRPHCGRSPGLDEPGVHVALALHPDVHVCLSGHYAFSKRAYPYLDLQPVAEELWRLFGPDRLLFGSDFPWVEPEPGYSPTLSLVGRHFPDIGNEDRAAILGLNARRVYGLGAC